MTLSFPDRQKLQTYLNANPATNDFEDKKILQSVAKIFANYKPMGSDRTEQSAAVNTKLGTLLYWKTKFEIIVSAKESSGNPSDEQLEKLVPEHELEKKEGSTNFIAKRSASEVAAEREKILKALMECLYNKTS